MIPTERFRATTDQSTTPFLFWSELSVCAGGAALACPERAGTNLHLDTVCFTTLTDEHYTPTGGVSVNADTGTMLAGNQARSLHAGQNRGLSVGYRWEDGCRGRIELREHKGHLFAGLHNQPPLGPDDLP